MRLLNDDFDEFVDNLDPDNDISVYHYNEGEDSEWFL